MWNNVTIIWNIDAIMTASEPSFKAFFLLCHPISRSFLTFTLNEQSRIFTLHNYSAILATQAHYLWNAFLVAITLQYVHTPKHTLSSKEEKTTNFAIQKRWNFFFSSPKQTKVTKLHLQSNQYSFCYDLYLTKFYIIDHFNILLFSYTTSLFVHKARR